ncbi:MAG: nitronate monooxygenase [Dehalococcoidia bacterium]|nr:nitronate monooxygenase [Dehalococcoidia bacterium]MDD5493358.1 nitronate monooxygenase [Dehalococcoidia bacterium]
MKTKITEAFGIKHPILLSGMAYVSLPHLVAAVSNAGGLGIFNSVANTPDQLKGIIQEIKSLTDKPFAINVTLIFPNGKENAEVALAEKAPIINFALGKGDWIIKAAHEYGGKVISTVATERHAIRAAEQGADALIVTAHEAAAHGSDIGGMVLLPQIASKVTTPIISAGGYCDGRGLAAAIALGADAIAMGTRFLLTQECDVHPNIKQTALKTNMEDTIYSDGIDGLPGRWYKNKRALEMSTGKTSYIEAMKSGWALRKQVDVPVWKLLFGSLQKRGVTELARQAIGVDALGKVLNDGDLENGVVPFGQVIGRIRDLPTCKEVIERMVSEAEDIIKSMQSKVA